MTDDQISHISIYICIVLYIFYISISIYICRLYIYVHIISKWQGKLVKISGWVRGEKGKIGERKI